MTLPKRSSEKLSRYTTQIREAYSSLGYTLGWRFLYTPARTLACPNGFMLVGINPGGAEFGITVSVEKGNAYLVEKWSPDGTRLQNQVKKFFELLAGEFLGCDRLGEGLLSKTLTTNFCPFRSPTWRQLPRRAEAIVFSKKLWNQLLSEVTPRVILCMGARPYSFLRKSLGRLATVSQCERCFPSGWGQYQFALEVFARGNQPIVLTRLLHLSQYKLMSRKECTPLAKEFIQKIHAAAGEFPFR
jgi:hypothetical protein